MNSNPFSKVQSKQLLAEKTEEKKTSIDFFRLLSLDHLQRKETALLATHLVLKVHQEALM